MTVELRPIARSDFPAFIRTFSSAFGWTPSPEVTRIWERQFEIDRSLAAYQDGQIVGTAGVESFRLTLPGLTETAAAGVTAVAVLPTHRRMGILTQMMRRQLDDIRRRGDTVAILWASESIIYGRFGYGLATNQVSLEIDPRHAAFDRSPSSSGRVRLVDAEEAGAVLPAIYDGARRLRPGQVNRKDGWWKGWLKDPEWQRHGGGAMFYLIHQGESGADGYAAYRIKGEWNEGIAGNTVMINELVAVTPESYASLWRYCLNLDLSAKVGAWNRPLDEPLRWMLADTRRLRFTALSDGLWLRLIDIPAALEARRYAAEGSLCFSILDPFCPDIDGTYHLEGGPDGACCRRTDQEPEISLHVDDLGATYLGGFRFSTLARAGRIEELRPGALHRADAMFASDHDPWCNHHF